MKQTKTESPGKGWAALIVVGTLAFAYALSGNYVALPGYLQFLERGRVSAAGNSFDLAVLWGATKMIAWMLSFQIGACCLFLAALVRDGLPRPRMFRWTFMVVAWLGFSAIPSIPFLGPWFYALFGGAVLVLIWLVNWRGRNAHASLAARREFLLAGLLFFALATWEICGLGSTGRMLHPQEVVRFGSEGLLITQSTKLMIELFLAWMFVVLSQRVGLRKEMA